MRGQSQRAGVQDLIPEKRSWARELAVRLEDFADRRQRADGELESILLLRALGECLRSLEKMEERTAVMEAQLHALLKRGG